MLQKYGIVQDGQLILNGNCLDGYKPVTYADIPEFDQQTQAVFQTQAVDMVDYIFVGNEIRELPPSEEGSMFEY